MVYIGVLTGRIDLKTVLSILTCASSANMALRTFIIEEMILLLTDWLISQDWQDLKE
jgi:hypothetical protein